MNQGGDVWYGSLSQIASQILNYEKLVLWNDLWITTRARGTLLSWTQARFENQPEESCNDQVGNQLVP